MGFIFGGDTGETQESIKSKRRIAQLMASRIAGPTPKNWGEGIGLIGQALMARGLNKQADRAEREGRDKFAPIYQGALDDPTQANISGALSDPWVSPGQRTVLSALFAQNAPPTKYQEMLQGNATRTYERGVLTSDRNYGLAQSASARAGAAAARTASKRDIIEDANGRKRYADTGEFVFEDFKAAEKVPPAITPYQEAQMKLRQKLQDERIEAGVDIPIGDVLGGGRPSLDPASDAAQPIEPDVTPAFGWKGAAKNIINPVTDFFGWGLAWPKADRAKRALTSLKTETVLSFKSLVNQRLSNQMITAFEKLTTEAGSGKEGALMQFKQTRELLQRALDNNQEVTANPENFLPQAVSDAGRDGIALQGILDRYNAIIENFDSGGAPSQTTGDSEADEILRRQGIIK